MLQPRDEALVAEVFLHRVMSRDQAIGLGFFGSVTRANTRLLTLTRAGLLKRVERAPEMGGQFLYRAGEASAPLLARRLDADQSSVRRLLVPPSPLCLTHMLRVLDLRLAFVRAAARGEFQIVRWLPELLCRHEFETKSPRGIWQRNILKPDGYIELQGWGGVSCIFVEVDLGHVSSARFAEKLAAYRTYLETGIFQEAYGRETFAVLVVTTGPRRLEHLRPATGQADAPPALFTTFQDIEALGVAGQIWRKAGALPLTLREALL
ncbi:MAG TPA: replication-relaxation family protein [Fimbriimonadaceae bacterium]|nr:replication-relaxation family protein [Fimbriimonadaceae bacterium]